MLVLFNIGFIVWNLGYEVGYSEGLSDKFLRDYKNIECRYKK